MPETDICPVCGSKMDRDAKTCSVCGTAFKPELTQCPLCNGDVGREDTVCPGCGADLSPTPSSTDSSVNDYGENEMMNSKMPSIGEKSDSEDIARSVYVDVELEELVKLPGIGLLRAKILFDAGYTDLRKLKQASVVELMNIRGIGRKAAGEIKTALRELSLEQIRETPLNKETVEAEHQCPLCATIVSAYETSCYECGCNFKAQDLDSNDSDRLALSYYDSKLLRAPDNKDLWYARGATLVKMESYDQAISSFNRAIEIDPSFQTAWMSKAEVYNKLGDSAKAAECYSHIMTSASNRQKPEADDSVPDVIESKEDEDLNLEPPAQEPAPAEPPKEAPAPTVKVAEPDFAQSPVASDTGPHVVKPSPLDFSDLEMDYHRPPSEKPDLDSMSVDELKKELSKRASEVKPYLKLAKEIGVDINHAKKLVARAVAESKQGEFKVAVQLMVEGIEFADREFRRKMLDDIENLAAVVRDLKAQGKDVSAPASLVAETKALLETGEIAQSVEKLRLCLEAVERIAA
ncbi:MAG: zinc ribbon domain-containing protein [Thermoplasmata archaeon]